jgi:hypothetical protein
VADALLSHHGNLLAFICHSSIVGSTAKELAPHLLQLIQSRGPALCDQLIRRLVREHLDRHVKKHQSLDNVFRDNSLSNLLLLGYATQLALPHVLDCLHPAFRRILALLAGCEVEWGGRGVGAPAPSAIPRSPSSSLNPARASAELQAQQDRIKIRIVCRLLLEGVLEQPEEPPAPLRRLCRFIHDLLVQEQGELERAEAAAATAAATHLAPVVPHPTLIARDMFQSERSFAALNSEGNLSTTGTPDAEVSHAPNGKPPAASRPLHQQLFVNRAFGTWPLTAKSEDNLSFVMASTGKIKQAPISATPCSAGSEELTHSSTGTMGVGVDAGVTMPATSQAFSTPSGSSTLPTGQHADGPLSLSLNFLSRSERVLCSLLFLRIIFPVLPSPEKYHLTPHPVPRGTQRCLVLCIKILTALANDVNVGTRGDALAGFNVLLDEYRMPLKHYVQHFIADVQVGGRVVASAA